MAVTREMILAELMRNTDTISEGDITIDDVISHSRVAWTTAKRRLDDMVKSGKLLRIWGQLPSGRWGWFYRIVS